MTIFPTNALNNLLQAKKQYIFKSVTEKNIQLLGRHIKRYPYIKAVLKKYNIMDLSTKNPNHNLLLEFYNYIDTSNKYVLNNGDILLIISIKHKINARGKYKAFIILYFLGILQRKNSRIKNKEMYNTYYEIMSKHIPSFIKIVPLTDNSFKDINTKCKKLIELNYNSIRYFQIREEFGKDIANNIYNNDKCKIRYIYGVKAKEDIISILKKDKAVVLKGFITKDKIIQEVKALNYYRQQNGEKYNKIYKSFTRFVSSLFLYNKEIAETLLELNLVYVRLNTRIINNIKQHQKQNNITDNTYILKPNMKVIVLKKLT